jgi:hypothetical protein
MNGKSFIVALSIVLFFSFLLNGAQKAKEIEMNQILETGGRDWKDIYYTYKFDSSYIEVLRAKVGDDLKIDVYLGVWCSDSRNNVPKFIKIIKTIEREPGLTVKYYTVERKASKDIKYFVDELKVERVPTFIFYRDGKEIGRIIENPRENMVEDILEIIF